MTKLRISLGIALFGFFLLLLYQFGLFVMVIWLNFKNPTTSAFMKAAQANAIRQQKPADINFSWVDYDNINKNLKHAVMVAEDADFINHTGVQWDSIKRAWDYNRNQQAQGKQKLRGGSTITQQLAKNLFLSGKRSYLRKAQELVLTYMIEAVMSKKRILELYLNVAQWGELTFGAEAAAKQYYKTSASKLSVNQAARLAVMLPRPVYYEKQGNTKYLQSRTAAIRKQLHLVNAP